MDMIEVRQVRKIIEFKKLLSELEERFKQMYFQNLQIRESMEIERANAKRERSESSKQRAQDQ